MLNGMEEFIYKNATLINYGVEKNINRKIHSAVLGPKDAILRKIFSHNVDKTLEDYRQQTGIDLKALAAATSKIEKEEKIPNIPAQIPTYLLTTESVANKSDTSLCNKSMLQRIMKDKEESRTEHFIKSGQSRIMEL